MSSITALQPGLAAATADASASRSPGPAQSLFPAELALLPRWVAWQTQQRKQGQKPTKVPHSPHGGAARADAPATWGTRPEAEAKAATLPRPFGLGGIGVQLGDLGAECILAGVDLDTCRDGAGTLAPWAQDVVERLGTYAEVSPSGTGVKLFFVLDTGTLAGAVPLLTGKGAALFKQPGGDHPPAIEFYAGHRYFAWTGDHLAGTPAEMRPVPPDALRWLLAEAGPELAAFPVQGDPDADDEAEAAITRQERPEPRRKPGGSKDKSRSALAFGIAAQVCRKGGDFRAFLAALDADADAAGWKADKGQDNCGRELQRCWDRARQAVGDDIDLTEHGIALAFARRCKDALRFCHHSGAWFEWTGTHWQRNDTRRAFDWARQLVAELNKDADFKTRAITGKAAFAAAVERFAQADAALAVTSETWDADPWQLGTPGGTVDLRTGKLRPARQADFITKLTGAAPSRAAPPDLWLRFLDDATGKDDELIRFLQRWCGYCLTGDTREHALLFGYGDGGNGKGVFVNTISRIMGSYSATAAMDTFIASQGDKHPTDLAMLRGARLVVASETEEGRAWAESRIKQMTGGDPITARFMREDFFTFRPRFKLTIMGNHKPVLRNVDDAARRRFNLAPFTRKPANPDRALEAKLEAEWPGILAWMIEGCLAWQENGLAQPPAVLAATAEYFEAQDHFGRWLAECCDILPTATTKPSRLLHSFTAWCQANGEPVADNRKMRGMIERTAGLRYAKVRGDLLVRGVCLKPPPERADDQRGEDGGR